MAEASFIQHRARTMRVAIASGKGGTGKTTLATNLAWLASISGLAVAEFGDTPVARAIRQGWKEIIEPQL